MIHKHQYRAGCARSGISCIIPPHLLAKLLESGDKRVSEPALNTLLTTTHLRGERAVRALLAVNPSPDSGRRTVYDCERRRNLTSARIARTEDGAASSDASVNRAFDGLGSTRDFYLEVFDRNSIDDRGMRLNGYVHFGSRYQNAFWDGQQMVFGDGDGTIFTDFTGSLDVIAHELTHGVIEYTANLEYHFQPGALNESIADVFGSLVKQWMRNEQASQADWLVGAEILTPGIAADALRSLKAPGTAYDNNLMGRDPQPAHMNDFVTLPDTEQGDWGGVHINSGIPNKAFYLAATSIGGYAWEAPGHIWYEALKASTVTTNFQQFADTTYLKAGQLYGANSSEQQAVAAAWREVGVRVRTTDPPRPSPRRDKTKDADSLLELRQKIDVIAEQVTALSKDVGELKTRRSSAATAR